MFDFSKASLLHSNILNFIIMISLIVFLIIKANAPAAVEALRKKIEEIVNSAIERKNNSHKKLEDSKDKVKTLDSEISEINTSASNALKSIEEKIANELKIQAENIEKNTEKVIGREVDKVNCKLNKGLSQAAVDLAENNIQKILSQNADLHGKYIQEAINELDKVSL